MSLTLPILRSFGFVTGIALTIGTVTIISFARILLIPIIPVNWDAPIYFDGAYRIYLGQTIHNDFSSATGLLSLFPGAVGMKIFGPNLLGYNFGVSLFSLTLTLILMTISLGVLNRGQAFLLSVTMSLFLASPLTFAGREYFSYTSAYNMAAYAVFSFICVILLALFSLPTNKRAKIAARISSATGFAIGLLVFIKYPIALISLLLVTIFTYFYPGNKLKFLKNIIISFSITLSFFLLSFRISPVAMMRDMGIVVASRDNLISQAIIQVSDYFTGLNVFILAVILCLYVALVIINGKLFRNLALIATAIILDLLLQITIQQPPEIILPLILSIPLIREGFKNPDRSIRLTTAVRITVMFPVVLFIYLNGYYYVSSALPKFFEENSLQAIKDLKIESIYEKEKDFDSVLSKNITKETKLITVGCNDVYSMKYRLGHATNTPLYWHDGVTFSKLVLRTNKYFIPDSIFEEVNLVGVSYSCPHSDSAVLFERHYLKYLEANFEALEKTEEYSIWRKIRIEIKS